MPNVYIIVYILAKSVIVIIVTVLVIHELYQADAELLTHGRTACIILVYVGVYAYNFTTYAHAYICTSRMYVNALDLSGTAGLI